MNIDVLKDKVFDVLVWILIIAFGLVTAYVTFEILNSQAEAEIQGYSFEGAFAGFIISSSVLASIYLQLRKSSNEVENLRAENRTLQRKLLRGTPRPVGFEIEVSERERIVLARPEKWRPRGGIIFDYQLPLDEHDERNFPPQFRVTYQPVEDDDGQSRYYANVKENLDKLIDEHEGVWDKYASWQSYSSEYIFLGGETQPVKSLKFIAHEYVHVERHPPDPLHTRSALGWRPITKDEYDRRVNNSKDGAELQYRGFDTEITYIFVVCYCEPLKTIYHFHFWDEHDHFLASSEWFNEIINSVRFLT